MTISPRTPEGWPSRCPLCASDFQLEPSTPHGDVPCPRCGHQLWFVETSSGFRVFDPDELARKIAERLGIDRSEIQSMSSLERDLGLDSLDLTELLMELEEEEGDGAE